ncbi:hypothetical protein [Anaeromyxobacter paludicola]|uniref:Uncharacterized protein n=1 Tax=Anaeromyxobacter paludicola TaxID=2918171 RepID=A0ABN6N347_9BACT|nr:hypothetical protein [Anaeromyxobacter paludicola]BDG07610.1 hypothetical protein AMPC_07230 [Anaeromyxobacter paludicola]
MSVALYLGEPRCGKTTLMRSHVYGSRAGVRAFFIVEHRPGDWDGAPFTVAQLRAAESIPRFCRFPGADPREVAQLAIDVGDVVLVDDEADGLFRSGKWHENPLLQILKRGEGGIPNAAGDNCAVHALLATHRPANLPADVVSLSQRIYIGRLRSFVDAERVYREGWLPDATSALAAQRLLSSRAVGAFTTWP